MNKKVIITDVDGVLVKWQSMLPFFAQEKGIDLKDILSCQYSEEFIHTKDLFKCTPEFSRILKKEYHNSDWIRYLSAYNDALEVINKLKEDYTFIAVTALEKSETALRNRSYNLNTLFTGVFSEIHLTDNDKESTFLHILAEQCESGNDVVAYIDDLAEHLLSFERALETIKLANYKLAPVKIQLARGKRDKYIFEDKYTYRAKDWFDVKEILVNKKYGF